jgi:hypothetical protein
MAEDGVSKRRAVPANMVVASERPPSCRFPSVEGLPLIVVIVMHRGSKAKTQLAVAPDLAMD